MVDLATLGHAVEHAADPWIGDLSFGEVDEGVVDVVPWRRGGDAVEIRDGQAVCLSSACPRRLTLSVEWPETVIVPPKKRRAGDGRIPRRREKGGASMGRAGAAHRPCDETAG